MLASAHACAASAAAACSDAAGAPGVQEQEVAAPGEGAELFSLAERAVRACPAPPRPAPALPRIGWLLLPLHCGPAPRAAVPGAPAPFLGLSVW
jgi:hypothetical protein